MTMHLQVRGGRYRCRRHVMQAGRGTRELRPCVLSGALAACALVAIVLLQAGARGASTSLVGEFNMAGEKERDSPWVDGLVVNHRVNTPVWPIYHKISPWPPQQMTVEQLYNALHESREYQAGSWMKDPSSLTGYSQALDPAKVPFLLDCREEGEYRRARIADAINIPLSQLQARLDEIPRDRPLFVIGQSGGARTDEATRFLRALGFVDVRHVDGGMSAWAQRIEPVLPQTW